MAFLQAAMRLEVAVLAACFAAFVSWKMLRDVVRRVRHPESGTALPNGIAGALRLQMPAVSLVVAVLYLVCLPQSAGRGSLPPVPDTVLALLACSHGVFLVVMAQRLLRPFGSLRNEGGK